jgi:Family of unknown function (DUF6402)
MAEKIPYLKSAGSNELQLVKVADGGVAVSNAHLYDDKALPINKTTAAAKSAPPPDVMETFVAWLRAPAPAPKTAAPAKSDTPPVVQYQYKLRDMPSSYAKAKAPTAEKFLNRFFKGKLNYSLDAQAAKDCINQNGQPYTDEFIDKDTVKLEAVLEQSSKGQSGGYGNKQYEKLISQTYLTQANQADKAQTLEAVASRIAGEPKNYRYQEKDVDIWQRCGGDSQKMHAYHFQEIEMDSAWFFWKDLGLALGGFKLYAMPAKATVDYYREGDITVTIPEIYVYLRKHYSFAGKNRYLGNCNKQGIIFVDKNAPQIFEALKNYKSNDKLKLEAPKGIGAHVSTEEKQSESSTYLSVHSSDLLDWQKQYQQGGDFIIFSDFKKIKLATPITVEVKTFKTGHLTVTRRAINQINVMRAKSSEFDAGLKKLENASAYFTIDIGNDLDAGAYGGTARPINKDLWVAFVNPNQLDRFQYLSNGGRWYSYTTEQGIAHEVGHLVQVAFDGGQTDTFNGGRDATIFENKVMKQLEPTHQPRSETRHHDGRLNPYR